MFRACHDVADKPSARQEVLSAEAGMHGTNMARRQARDTNLDGRRAEGEDAVALASRVAVGGR
jgi:hypothetical protein